MHILNYVVKLCHPLSDDLHCPHILKCLPPLQTHHCRTSGIGRPPILRDIMGSYKYPIVFMAIAIATSAVSVILILVMVVPYQQRSITLYVVSRLVCNIERMLTDRKHTLCSNQTIPTSTSRYGYGGYGDYSSSAYSTPYLYSDYSGSESTYTTTLGSAYGSAYVQTYTQTRYYYTATPTGSNPFNARESAAAVAAVVAPRATTAALAAPLLPRQDTATAPGSAATTSSSPSTTPTTIAIRQGAPGAILLIVFLVIIAFIFIESTALAAYIGQKSARLIKQEEQDTDEGVRQPLATAAGGSRAQTPAGAEEPGVQSPAAEPTASANDAQQQAPDARTASATDAAAEQAASPRSRRYATVKHAKCHFACLLLLAIALL